MSNPYRDRLLTIGTIAGGRHRDETVTETRAPDGHLVKATTDHLGNTVTEHAVPGDRVDVHINAPRIRVSSSEERD